MKERANDANVITERAARLRKDLNLPAAPFGRLRRQKLAALGGRPLVPIDKRFVHEELTPGKWRWRRKLVYPLADIELIGKNGKLAGATAPLAQDMGSPAVPVGKAKKKTKDTRNDKWTELAEEYMRQHAADKEMTMTRFARRQPGKFTHNLKKIQTAYNTLKRRQKRA